MTDNIKLWLTELYKGEIENEKATLENEEVWRDGSIDSNSFACHTQNIEEHKKYIETLESLIEELNFN